MRTRIGLSATVALITLLSSTSAFAITTSGTLAADETWSGTVLLAGDVTVPSGVTLTIEQGTLVKSPSTSIGRQIQVMGTIDVRGSATAGVRLELGPGLFLRAGSHGTFRYTTLSGALMGIIASAGSDLMFTDGEIVGMTELGMRVSGTAEIARTRFLRNRSKALTVLGSAASIHNNEFRDNCVVSNSPIGTVEIDSNREVTFDHNTVSGNRCLIGVNLTTEATVTNNIISANRLVGVNWAGDPHIHAVVRRNLINEVSDVANLASVEHVFGDPRFLSATDVRLRFDSPALHAALDGSDLGAYAFEPPGPVMRAIILPQPIQLTVGGQVTLRVEGRDLIGTPASLGDSTPVWTTNAGSITAAGVFTAGTQAGVFPEGVAVSVAGLVASVPVTVLPGPANTLTVSPANLDIHPGRTAQLSAIVLDAHGNRRDQDQVLWTMVTPAAGVITTSGLFLAGNNLGSFPGAVRGQVGTITGTASITVSPRVPARLIITPGSVSLPTGDSTLFTLEARDADEQPLTVTPEWSVANGGGTIDASGRFTAGTLAGTFVDTVTATVGGLAIQATVVVEPGPVTRVVVAPTSLMVAPGGVSQLTATAFDEHDNQAAVDPVWSVTDATAGSIDNHGHFVAGSVAASFPDVIVARVGAVSARASVTVVPGALARLAIDPALVSLLPGEHTVLALAGFDEVGNRVEVTGSWSVVHGGGSIDDAGELIAGNQAGVFADSVLVTAGGVSATATIEVRPGPLTHLRVLPGALTLGAGSQVTFAVDGFDAAGNQVELDAPRWSAHPAAGTITADGKFTAGTVAGMWPEAVTVSVGGVTEHAAVQVTVVDAPQPMPEEKGGGCGCSVGTRRPSPVAGALLLVVGVVLLDRRRRQARRAR